MCSNARCCLQTAFSLSVSLVLWFRDWLCMLDPGLFASRALSGAAHPRTSWDSVSMFLQHSDLICICLTHAPCQGLPWSSVAARMENKVGTQCWCSARTAIHSFPSFLVESIVYGPETVQASSNLFLHSSSLLISGVNVTCHLVYLNLDFLICKWRS